MHGYKTAISLDGNVWTTESDIEYILLCYCLKKCSFF